MGTGLLLLRCNEVGMEFEPQLMAEQTIKNLFQEIVGTTSQGQKRFFMQCNLCQGWWQNDSKWQKILETVGKSRAI